MTDKDTIRREVAAAVLPILLDARTRSDIGAQMLPSAENIAKLSVQFADALLAELARTGKEEASASEKPATRYDWSSAPEWAMFATTDPDGEWCWWEGAPSAHDRWWDRMSGGRHEPSNGNVFGLPMTTSDWRDSLERRPT